MEAEATAAMWNSMRGFQTPGDGGNVGILPFALDEETWNQLVAGNADDNWSWDPQTGTMDRHLDFAKPAPGVR